MLEDGSPTWGYVEKRAASCVYLMLVHKQEQWQVVLEDQVLATRKKFLIGGGGALAPIFLNLLVIDLQTLLLDVTWLAVLSYIIRVATLFAVGGFMALLNRSESDPWKIFQLGIAAPALLTALINGRNITTPEQPASGKATVSAAAGRLEKPNVFGLAYAEDSRTEQIQLNQFSLPKETAAQQIFRGLLGSTPKNVWFVIAGSHRTLIGAERQAKRIRAKGFSADVYEPYGGNPYYTVVIGAQLTRSEADQLRSKAIKAGLPADTYLWTFPRE